MKQKNFSYFEKVRQLNLPFGKYALFGSAPLGIRGLKECHDIDIIVTEDLYDEYLNKGWKIDMMPHGAEYLIDEDIELWKNWAPGEWNIK